MEFMQACKEVCYDIKNFVSEAKRHSSIKKFMIILSYLVTSVVSFISGLVSIIWTGISLISDTKMLREDFVTILFCTYIVFIVSSFLWLVMNKMLKAL